MDLKIIQKIDNIILSLLNNNPNIRKMDVINELKEKTLIKKEGRSLYRLNWTNILIKFVDAKKKNANCIIAFKTIKRLNNDNFLLSYKLGDRITNIQSMNIPFITKISHSSKWITEEHIKGTIVMSNIKKDYLDLKNNKENILNWKIYKLYSDHNDEKYIRNQIKNIITNTKNIKWRDRKKIVITKEIIEKLINDNKGITKDQEKIEKIIKEKYITPNLQKITEIFNKRENSKYKGTDIEEIITLENTGNQFADMSPIIKIEDKEYNLDINIKASDFSINNKNNKDKDKLSHPNMFNLYKFKELLKDLYNQRKPFYPYFLFIYKNKDWNVRCKLVNMLEESFIKEYTLDDRYTWRWKNSGTAVQSPLDVNRIEGVKNNINKEQVYSFLEE